MNKRMSIILVLVLLVSSVLTACGGPAPVSFNSLPVFTGAVESTNELLTATLPTAVDAAKAVSQSAEGKAYDAPEGWNALLTAMAKQSISEAELVQAGLVLPRQTGSGFYDRFRGRLLFPIRDLQGRVIAFCGRALGAEEPKYLNSPETPLYQKGQTLYALHLAREVMAGSRRALVVEGYIDALMAHQAGIRDTVEHNGHPCFDLDELCRRTHGGPGDGRGAHYKCSSGEYSSGNLYGHGQGIRPGRFDANFVHADGD